MIPAYFNLLLTFFSILSEVPVLTNKIQYDEKTDCECGRSYDFSFRIVGGRQAQPYSNPWITALYSKFHKKIFCGGALINDRYVLTAGHCVKVLSKQYLAVVLGLHDKELFYRNQDGLLVDIDNIKIHENFSTVSFYYVEDIALLKLKRIITYTELIRPICLPKDRDNDYRNKIVQAVGWGKTYYNTKKFSRFLKEADLMVLSYNDCKNNKIIGPYVLDSMLCAYSEEADACQGDSGGPLVYENVSGKKELIGIVSWGIKCAKKDIPGIYTRITSNLDWIYKNTQDAIYCQKPKQT